LGDAAVAPHASRRPSAPVLLGKGDDADGGGISVLAGGPHEVHGVGMVIGQQRQGLGVEHEQRTGGRDRDGPQASCHRRLARSRRASLMGP
jgi:hypothetical protein